MVFAVGFLWGVGGFFAGAFVAARFFETPRTPLAAFVAADFFAVCALLVTLFTADFFPAGFVAVAAFVAARFFETPRTPLAVFFTDFFTAFFAGDFFSAGFFAARFLETLRAPLAVFFAADFLAARFFETPRAPLAVFCGADFFPIFFVGGFLEDIAAASISAVIFAAFQAVDGTIGQNAKASSIIRTFVRISQAKYRRNPQNRRKKAENRGG